MRNVITGRNIEITNGLRNSLEKKLGKLDKYFSQEVEANIRLSVQKNQQIIEVTIPFDGAILRAEEKRDDMYQSIDDVVGTLERQIRKHKTKLQRRSRNGKTIRFENIISLPHEDKEEQQIVKTKRFSMKPMDAEEAVLQMELIGHSFFVYKDAKSNDLNVVYKRKDGNYGLIEAGN